MTVSHSLSKILLTMAATAVFNAGAARAADADAGKILYAAKCKTCHGADGTPAAAFAKMGVKPMNDPTLQAKSDSDLKDSILKGIGKMKPQSVTSDEADNLVAAIRTMK